MVERGDRENEREIHTEQSTQRKKHKRKESYRHRKGDAVLKEGDTDTHMEAHIERKTHIIDIHRKIHTSVLREIPE